MPNATYILNLQALACVVSENTFKVYIGKSIYSSCDLLMRQIISSCAIGVEIIGKGIFAKFGEDPLSS